MKLCTRCQIPFEATNWLCPACANKPPNVNGISLLAPESANEGGRFPPEVFEKLAALESQNFWFQSRNRLIVWALKRHFPTMRNYLEIGCGTGYVLAGVAQAYSVTSLVGSEIYSGGLPYAALRAPTAELVQMDARHIPYVDEFDVIGAFDVLEHIEQDEQVLAAMWRALRPGGGIAITVPQHPWLWSSADTHACHVRRYKMNELRDKVLRAGFTPQFETSFVSLLLPAMLASRLGTLRKASNEKVLSELSLPGWMNHVFGKIMNIERQLIRIGFRFSLGGSRILIAIKER